MTDVNTRSVVLDILLEVNEHGAMSHIVIGDALKKYQYLDKRDRAFISRLSQGTIERQITLDYIINQVASTPVEKMKPVIRTIMRMSVYQIMYMDVIPDSAACNEAVKLAVKKGFTSLKGFVNGVLRQIARSKADIKYPVREDNPVYYMSIMYSVPEWIISKWLLEYDADTIIKALEAGLLPKETTIRVNENVTSVEELTHSLKEKGLTVKKAAFPDVALTISNFDYLEAIDEFKKGYFQVQDISSMLVGIIANPKANDRCIDVCAAPGGKSIHLGELLRGTGHVDARDLTDYKVALIEENISRMGSNNVTANVWDATELHENSVESADIVIADLPCSGLGVMGRKKDIRYKMDKKTQSELVALQRDILSVVRQYVKPGGILVYSTCTVNADENIKNAKWFAGEFDFEMESITRLVPNCLKSETTDEGYIQLLPGMYGSDGFFISKFRRKK